MSVWQTLDRRVGTQLTSALADNGIEALAWWGSGFLARHDLEKHPSWYRGSKLRIHFMQSAIHQAISGRPGADAVPMNWGELCTLPCNGDRRWRERILLPGTKLGG